LRIESDSPGFRGYTFTDLSGALCSLQESYLASAVWLGFTEYPRMHLTRDHAAALLPLLKHFAETGELPIEPNES
jgi:hypothetical protein